MEIYMRGLLLVKFIARLLQALTSGDVESKLT